MIRYIKGSYINYPYIFTLRTSFCTISTLYIHSSDIESSSSFPPT